MSDLIQVADLHKTYETDGVKTLAIRGVSFKIERGEFVAIMGPSGSGKSTLMQMLGLLDQPTKGEYLLSGRNVSDLSDDDMANLRNVNIGFIFQSFNLLARTTVYENVELPLLYDHRKTNVKENSQKIKKALKAVMLEHRVDHFSNQLSGGEKQRVAIARALVNDPDLIFADEPTGNLDSKSGTQIMKILQNLNDDGKTIILVTHETQTANHAKRVIRVVDGQINGDRQVKGRLIAQDGAQLK